MFSMELHNIMYKIIQYILMYLKDLLDKQDIKLSMKMLLFIQFWYHIADKVTTFINVHHYGDCGFWNEGCYFIIYTSNKMAPIGIRFLWEKQLHFAISSNIYEEISLFMKLKKSDTKFNTLRL